MVSFAKLFPLLILFTLLSSIHTHARESQFFNKASTTTNYDVVPYSKQPQNNQQQEPNFLPDNENGYGLYGRDSGQLLPYSATTNGGPATTAFKTESKQPLHKYLPRNYNPVAYVTEPEDLSESTTFADAKRFTSNPDNNNFYDGSQNYHNNPQEEDSEYRNNPTTTKNRNGNNGGSSFNSGGDTLTSRGEYFKDGGSGANGYETQGMSDTRLLENGKYFYDVNTEKYSSNHPYESFKGVSEINEYNNRNYYGNGENGYELNGSQNSMGGYQNQYEFQDEENNNLHP